MHIDFRKEIFGELWLQYLRTVWPVPRCWLCTELSRTFFKFLKGLVSLSGPPDLSADESRLRGPVEHPLVSRLVLVRLDAVLEDITQGQPHAVRHSVQPSFHLAHNEMYLAWT